MNLITRILLFASVMWIVIGNSIYHAPTDKELWGSELE